MEEQSQDRRGLRALFSSPTFLLALVGALALGLRLFRLGEKPLWSAEIQEIFNARCAGFLSNLRDSGSDIAGFFWHNLVWRLGLEPLELFSRLPSVVWGVVAVPVAYLWGREMAGRRAGLAAAFVASFAVYMVDLSQTARWYVAAAVCGNAAVILLYRRLRQESPGWVGWVPIWLAASVAVLSHAMAVLFLLVQFLLVLYLDGWEGRKRPAAVVRRCAALFLPVFPALSLQAVVTISFRVKLAYHPKVFLVGRPYGLGGLIESVPASLMGAWTPFWVLFLGLSAWGLWRLFHLDRRAGVVVATALVLPLAALGVLVWAVGPNAFDMTFVSFLFGPAYACLAVCLDRAPAAFRTQPRVGAALFALPLLILCATNGWLLSRYYASPVKPALGPDYRTVAKILKGSQPGPEDILFFRYGEFFTHLAFYSAEELQQFELVAERVPAHSRALLMEYLHRLNGCTDRPRVQPDQVRQLSDLAGSELPLGGRIFALVSCPARYGPPTPPGEEEPKQMEPDYAAWVLGKGALDLTCGDVPGYFAGFEVYVLPGVVLAWRDARGERRGDVAEQVSAIFSRLPQERLRVRPPKE